MNQSTSRATHESINRRPNARHSVDTWCRRAFGLRSVNASQRARPEHTRSYAITATLHGEQFDWDHQIITTSFSYQQTPHRSHAKRSPRSYITAVISYDLVWSGRAFGLRSMWYLSISAHRLAEIMYCCRDLVWSRVICAGVRHEIYVLFVNLSPKARRDHVINQSINQFIDPINQPTNRQINFNQAITQ